VAHLAEGGEWTTGDSLRGRIWCEKFRMRGFEFLQLAQKRIVGRVEIVGRASS
jgi:hypothetical protein